MRYEEGGDICSAMVGSLSGESMEKGQVSKDAECADEEVMEDTAENHSRKGQAVKRAVLLKVPVRSQDRCSHAGCTGKLEGKAGVIPF